MMIVSRGSISFPLSISVSMAISTISITMMIITGGSLPLAISISMAISVRVAMTIITWLSIGFSNSISFSFPLSITIAMAISMRVTMVVISWLSISLSYSSWLGFSLAIAIAMTITTISMMVISWLSYGCSEEGKGNSNQKIHLLVGLNSSETPPCTLRYHCFPC